MKHDKLLLLLLTSLVVLTGCSSLDPAIDDLNGGVSNQYLTQRKTFAAVAMLQEQLQAAVDQNRIAALDHSTPVIVTTLVDINKVDSHQADAFGREVSELVASQLSQSYQVTEFRLERSVLLVPDTGEFALSRLVSNLPESTKAAKIIVVGTYLASDGGTSTHLKALDPKTGQILASADFVLPFDATGTH